MIKEIPKELAMQIYETQLYQILEQKLEATEEDIKSNKKQET